MNSISVVIKDFQSIDDLRFDVTGFTCITGPSNIGKSAIVRAISGALLNSPTIGAVRKGKKFCSVDIKASDWGVKWEKGERVGRYWIPGEDKPRDGIGQGQTEITADLGFRSVKVGDKRITPWLADQFSPIFLLDQSGPSVTDFISDITRLKVLQNAIVLNARNKQRLVQSAQVREEEAAKLSSVEERFSGVAQLTSLEGDLVAQMESVSEYEASIAGLRSLSERMELGASAVESLSDVKGIKVPAETPSPDELRELVRMWSALESTALLIHAIKDAGSVSVPEGVERDELDSILEASRFLAIRPLSDSVESLKKASSISVPAMPADEIPEIQELESTRLSISEAESFVKLLSAEVPDIPEMPEFSPESLSEACALLSKLEDETAAEKGAESALSSVSQELDEVLAELAAIPTCPTCRQVYVPDHSHAAGG